MVNFPGLNKFRNAQIGNRETAKSSLGFGAPAGGSFVADLPSHPRGGARIRRNSGGMIVSFHFHQDVRLFLAIFVSVILAGIKASNFRPLDNGRIIRISNHRAARILLVSIAYH